jgi:hypothetical protein
MLEFRPPRIDEPAAGLRPVQGGGEGVGGDPPGGYFADFVAVRRQRVQTSAFTDDPLVVIV